MSWAARVFSFPQKRPVISIMKTGVYVVFRQNVNKNAARNYHNSVSVFIINITYLMNFWHNNWRSIIDIVKKLGSHQVWCHCWLKNLKNANSILSLRLFDSLITDNRTNVWSLDFIIWKIYSGLWAVVWTGLWNKRVWADYKQLLRPVFSFLGGQKKF